MTASVLVRNLSTDTTEESVQDYFSFCGDIQAVRVEEGDGGRSKEATIVFESEAAASTAVLLNNALVDGRNIVVELVSGGGAGSVGGAWEGAGAAAGSQASVQTSSSVVTGLLSEAKVMAGQVSTATKDFNAKYDVTGKVKAAYTTAAASTSQTFKRLDEQYDLKGSTAKAVDATKAGLSSVYKKMSGLWQQPGGNASNSASLSSGPSPNSASSERTQ